MNIKELYMNVFPKSHVAGNNGHFGGDDLYIRGYIQSPDEWINKISNNDPFNFMIIYNPITNVYQERELSLIVKPTRPNMVYGHVKMRKKTIKNVTPEKITARFEQIRDFIKSNLPDAAHDITDKV